jgi:hypothetical protein
VTLCLIDALEYGRTCTGVDATRELLSKIDLARGAAQGSAWPSHHVVSSRSFERQHTPTAPHTLTVVAAHDPGRCQHFQRYNNQSNKAAGCRSLLQPAGGQAWCQGKLQSGCRRSIRSTREGHPRPQGQTGLQWGPQDGSPQPLASEASARRFPHRSLGNCRVRQAGTGSGCGGAHQP